MRVLISGGGIAGLTLAYWLQKSAIPVVVIEQAKTLRRDGYAIDFLGTGYEVASRMSLIDRLSSQQIPFDDVAYVNKAGKLIARLDAALLRTITDGKYMGLMHWTLEEVLYEALAGTVEVRFGRSLTHVVSNPDAVVVAFTDGTTESFDLLIGADGVHSTTRALVFGPEDQFSRYLGYTIACYPLADRYDIGHAWKMYLEPGRLAAAYCTPQAGEILTFFMYQVAQKEHLPREQRLPRLREVFAGMGWLTQQFLSDVSPNVPVFMDAVIQIQMPTWHQGRVALVGDACDCPTLLSGQGASLAMGGAYLLARALHETTDYQEAFRRYEQQMYAYVQAQQKSARSFAKSFLPGSPLGLFVQQTMMKVLLRETFRGLLRRQMGAESILPPLPIEVQNARTISWERRLQGLVEFDREAPVAEQLMTLTHQFASTMQWMSRLMPIAFEFYAIAGRDKDVRQFLKEYFQDYRTLLARLIQRGIERGEFRAVDAEATAITLAALNEGLALLIFVDQEAVRWAEQAETSARLPASLVMTAVSCCSCNRKSKGG